MTGARIIFISFSNLEASKLVPWREHSRLVAGSSLAVGFDPASAPDSPRRAVVWHLVSGNNRVLARGALIHSNLDDATVAARSLRNDFEPFEVTLVDDASKNVYGWFAGIGGLTIMTCSRWYSSERDRRHSLESALTNFDLAAIQLFARSVADRSPARVR